MKTQNHTTVSVSDDKGASKQMPVEQAESRGFIHVVTGDSKGPPCDSFSRDDNAEVKPW